SQKVAQAGGKLWSWRSVLTYSFVTLVIIIIVINGIVKSINTKDITPLINDVGGRIVYTIVEINRASLEIIQRNSVFDFSFGVLRGLFRGLLSISDLLSSVFILYYWLKGFIWLFAKTLGNYNFMLDFLGGTFAFLSIIIIFLLVSSSLQLNWFDIPLNNKLDVLLLPFVAMKNLFSVITIFIILPLYNLTGDIAGKSPDVDNITSTLNNLTSIT
ncbi:MAG: hypothetical protein AABY22_03785, partial [Nanoarchaeota archaeon]